MVHRLNNPPTGAEIVAQQHTAALPGPGRCRRDIALIFFQEDLRVCQPELIDGLFDIPHQKAILLFCRNAPENGILHRIGVLVFVHHNLPEPGPDFPGRRRGAIPAGSQQQVQTFLLQISKVQHPALLFQQGVLPAKPPHQLHQPPLGQGRLPQVRQHGPGIPAENPGPFLQAILAGVPHRLHFLHPAGIHALGGETQRPKRHPDPLMHLVPGLARLQLPQAKQGIPEILFHLPHTGLPGKLSAALQGGTLALQPGKQILHQKFSPLGLPRILYLGLGTLQALFQPLFRVRMTPGAIIDLGNKLRQGRIRPAQPLGIRKGPESLVL